MQQIDTHHRIRYRSFHRGRLYEGCTRHTCECFLIHADCKNNKRLVLARVPAFIFRSRGKLFFHPEEESATRLALYRSWQTIDGGDGPLPISAISKEGALIMFVLQERKGKTELLLLVGAVYTCNIPRSATATRQHSTLSGIAADEAGLVPGGGELGKEALHGGRL